MIDLEKLVRFAWNVALYCGCLLITYLVNDLLMCGFFLVHEMGHVLFGSLGNVFHGVKGHFYIESWIPTNFIPGLACPQSIRMDGGFNSVWFAYGGVTLVIIFVVFLSLYVYQKTKMKWYFGFVGLFVFHEFFDSFCGTDHWGNKIYAFCRDPIVSQWSSVFADGFFLLTATILFIHTKGWINRFLLRNKGYVIF